MSEKSKTEANSISENISQSSASRARGRGRGRIMGPVFVPDQIGLKKPNEKPNVIDPTEEFGSDDETLKDNYERSSLTLRGKPMGSRPKGVLSTGRSYGRGRGGRSAQISEKKVDP